MTQRAVAIRESDGFRIVAKIGALNLDPVRGRMRYTPPSAKEQSEWQAAGWRLEWRIDGEEQSR